MFYKIRVIFSRKQKLKFIILAGILFVGSLLEFMGVSLILPFVQLVMEPEGEYGEEMMVLGSWFQERTAVFDRGLADCGLCGEKCVSSVYEICAVSFYF